MDKKTILLLLLTLLFSACEDIDKSTLRGNDYRLFQGTQVWDLAKAVENEDTGKIKKIIIEDKVDVNCQEVIFGQTLLMLAVQNKQYNECKVLLELGADPNKHSNYDGRSAIIYSAGITDFKNENASFLQLMLAYKGNPNDEETGERRVGNSTRQTPLLLAISDVSETQSPIKKVKMLVEVGANINYKNEFNAFPLAEALLFKHYDVVLYLLQKGADYSLMIFDRANFYEGGEKIYIVGLLREDLQPLHSKKYLEKMAVVDFLKNKGVDYRDAPVPEFVLKKIKEDYPNNWKKYLEKY